MSADDDFLSELQRTDPWIAAITPERVGDALAGFPLPLADGWNLMRLVREIQDIANYARGETPQGNAAAIKELKQLAKQAEALRVGIKRLGETAENAVFWELFRHSGEGQKAERIDYDDDYRSAMLHPLVAIKNVLTRAASQIGTQKPQAPRWPERHRRDRRVGFAVALIPIFQDSFDTPARANNWRAEYGEEHPWPDFFRRIYGELSPEAERLNLSEVLQEAARELPKVEEMRRWLDEQEATRSENFGE